MAIWKRKKKPPVPPVPVEEVDFEESPTSMAIFASDRQGDGRRIDALLDAIANVSASRDLEDLLGHVVDSAVATTEAERGILLLPDGPRAQPQVRVARGGGVNLEDVKYSTSVVKKVLDSGAPMRTQVRAGETPSDLGASVVNLKLRAVMCVPVDPPGERSGGRGVLYVDSTAATREFTAADLALFHALAQHIAIALENARLSQMAVERARLQRSLEIAEEIQQGLMPSESPRSEPWSVHGWFRAAEHAAGDFFDYLVPKDGALSAVVGDVSGHGIGPALVTATAQAGLRAYLRVVSDPAQVIGMLNRDLSSRMDAGMFLTLVLAQMHPDGRLQIVNAGHPPPLLWRKAEQRIESLDAHDVAIGMSADYPYECTIDTRMEPGDMLLIYSDGLVEARHPDHPDRFFGEDGLRAVLADVGHRAGAPEQLVEELSEAVLEFCEGSREDDMTFVAVQRKG